MGIDIGGAFTIAGVSDPQVLKIAGASDALIIDKGGRTTYPNQIGFIAALSTDPGWLALALNWNIQNWMNVTSYNKGGGFVSGRFTAPVAGSYLFHLATLINKLSAVQSSYCLINFWINGGAHGSGYHIRGHYSNTGQSLTGEAVDILYLNAGDYVDAYVYTSTAGFQLYRSYSQFSGFLVG